MLGAELRIEEPLVPNRGEAQREDVSPCHGASMPYAGEPGHCQLRAAVAAPLRIPAHSTLLVCSLTEPHKEFTTLTS